VRLHDGPLSYSHSHKGKDKYRDAYISVHIEKCHIQLAQIIWVNERVFVDEKHNHYQQPEPVKIIKAEDQSCHYQKPEGDRMKHSGKDQRCFNAESFGDGMQTMLPVKVDVL
jgi:hypothetical protein